MTTSKNAVARSAARQATQTNIEAVTAQYVTWIDSKGNETRALDALQGAAEISNDPATVLAEADRLYTADLSTPLTAGFFGVTPVQRPAALTAAAAAAPAGGVGAAAGGWDTAANRDAAIATINNLRTRVNELESKLQALGLIS